MELILLPLFALYSCTVARIYPTAPMSQRIRQRCSSPAQDPIWIGTIIETWLNSESRISRFHCTHANIGNDKCKQIPSLPIYCPSWDSAIFVGNFINQFLLALHLFVVTLKHERCHAHLVYVETLQFRYVHFLHAFDDAAEKCGLRFQRLTEFELIVIDQSNAGRLTFASGNFAQTLDPTPKVRKYQWTVQFHLWQRAHFQHDFCDDAESAFWS